MQKAVVETREGKSHELIIVAQKYPPDIAEERQEPNLGLSFFLDEKLVQSLIKPVRDPASPGNCR